MNQKIKPTNPQDRLDSELWNLLQQIEYERFLNPGSKSITFGVYIVDKKFRLLEILEKEGAFTMRQVGRIGGSISSRTGVHTIDSFTPSNLVLDIKPDFEKIYEEYEQRFEHRGQSFIASPDSIKLDEEIILDGESILFERIRESEFAKSFHLTKQQSSIVEFVYRNRNYEKSFFSLEELGDRLVNKKGNKKQAISVQIKSINTKCEENHIPQLLVRAQNPPKWGLNRSLSSCKRFVDEED